MCAYVSMYVCVSVCIHAIVFTWLANSAVLITVKTLKQLYFRKTENHEVFFMPLTVLENGYIPIHAVIMHI